MEHEHAACGFSKCARIGGLLTGLQLEHAKSGAEVCRQL